MLYFGRVGSSWGHCAFFGSSWGKNVITPLFYLFLLYCLKIKLQFPFGLFLLVFYFCFYIIFCLFFFFYFSLFFIYFIFFKKKKKKKKKGTVHVLGRIFEC
jgi:hypothetical protein